MLASLGAAIAAAKTGKRWHRKTLVVGPFEPVDGDSVACTKALITFLRRYALEAYTLPTLSMYAQIDWILERSDFHPMESFPHDTNRFLTTNLQSSYDKLLKVWRPGEIVLVDGPANRLGFDPRGVRVYSIDHHNDGQTNRDDRKGFMRSAPSAGCVLIECFNIWEPILAVSILTDTFWLRHNQPSSAIKSFARLTKHGLTDALLGEYQRKLMVKDSHILTVLRCADMRLFQDGDAVFTVLTDPSPELHRGVMGELGYFCRHICVVRGDGYVSMKTADPEIDLTVLSIKYGGGGHKNMAAMKLNTISPEIIEKLYSEFVQIIARTEHIRV